MGAGNAMTIRQGSKKANTCYPEHDGIEWRVISASAARYKVEVLPSVWVYVDTRPRLWHRVVMRVLFGWRFISTAS